MKLLIEPFQSVNETQWKTLYLGVEVTEDIVDAVSKLDGVETVYTPIKSRYTACFKIGKMFDTNEICDAVRNCLEQLVAHDTPPK